VRNAGSKKGFRLRGQARRPAAPLAQAPEERLLRALLKAGAASERGAEEHAPAFLAQSLALAAGEERRSIRAAARQNRGEGHDSISAAAWRGWSN
jgi:hypothetical protein